MTEGGVFNLPAFRREDGKIAPVHLAWHAWGELNPARDNAVLICHYFSATSRPAGPGGWWEPLIGPGKVFDTGRYYVLCLSMLNNVNWEETATLAPGATVRDSVRLQKLLLDQLDIRRLACVAGPSMGGFQALTWALEYPEVPRAVIAATTAPFCPPWTALVPVQACIEAVESDQGEGLARAALIQTTAARTHEWVARAYVGGAVVEQMRDLARSRAAAWDRERYVAMARSWQRFDLTAGHPEREAALARIKARVLLLPVSTDLLFPPGISEDFAAELRGLGVDAVCQVIASHGGHLAAVAECGILADPIRAFLG